MLQVSVNTSKSISKFVTVNPLASKEQDFGCFPIPSQESNEMKNFIKKYKKIRYTNEIQY